MSERDWADEAANKLATTIRQVSNGHTDPGPWSIEAMANALRQTDADAHARGLREGAAAERQRAAAVCEAKQKGWAAKHYKFPSGKWSHRQEAAADCRDAILRGDGGEAEQAKTYEDGLAYGLKKGLAEGSQVERDKLMRAVREMANQGAPTDYGRGWAAALTGLVGKVTAVPEPAAEPHGPPVAADPAEGQCGSCSLWKQWRGSTFGYCLVTRDFEPPAAGYTVYDAQVVKQRDDHACDVGAWRAKGK